MVADLKLALAAWLSAKELQMGVMIWTRIKIELGLAQGIH
jgi:hypothetical protein